MGLEELLFSFEPQWQKIFQAAVVTKEPKHKQTPQNAATLNTLISIPFNPPLFLWWVALEGKKEGQEKKEQCSLASGVTEWHFYDVSQIIPWDGWAEPDNQLINPSTDGMCCGHPPAQLFPPRSQHSARPCWRGWLMREAPADTIHVCLCMCDQH